MAVPRRRPLERVVRRLPRVQSQRIAISPDRPLKRWRPSSYTFLISFPILIGIGTVLLSFPIATEGPGRAPFLVALFTATSATCVTGLTVVDTGPYWSNYGEAVILGLIQLGGLSYVTGVAVLLLAVGQRVSLSQRQVLRVSLGGGVLGRVDVEAVEIVAMAILFQALAASALFWRFLMLDYDTGQALWLAVFQGISAFNNAGFDNTGGLGSLAEFHNDPFIVLPIALAAIVGASGVGLVTGVIAARRWGKFTLEAKMVMVAGGVLLAAGTLGILVSEWTNPATAGNLPIWEKVMGAFAHSAWARTTGFSTYDLGVARDYTLFVLLGLMFVGGASGSMAGGIKLTTFTVLAATVWSNIKGRPRTEVFGREIPENQVRNALSVLVLAFMWVNVVALVLTLLEPGDFLDLLFEATSAFGIVGLSTGVTGVLSEPGQLVVIVTMLLGRLGPLTIALALARKQSVSQFRYAREEVRIG